jgi:hypothetical protein
MKSIFSQEDGCSEPRQKKWGLGVVGFCAPRRGNSTTGAEDVGGQSEDDVCRDSVEFPNSRRCLRE